MKNNNVSISVLDGFQEVHVLTGRQQTIRTTLYGLVAILGHKPEEWDSLAISACSEDGEHRARPMLAPKHQMPTSARDRRSYLFGMVDEMFITLEREVNKATLTAD